eukprot:2663757-Prorocentrum_lima.AAC.1
MGQHVYVLPRTPEEIATAGGLRDAAAENTTSSRTPPQWDTPGRSPRPYEVDVYPETHAPA